MVSREHKPISISAHFNELLPSSSGNVTRYTGLLQDFLKYFCFSVIIYSFFFILLIRLHKYYKDQIKQQQKNALVLELLWSLYLDVLSFISRVQSPEYSDINTLYRRRRQFVSLVMDLFSTINPLDSSNILKRRRNRLHH